MVLKRIFVCLTMISLVFSLSCYDVDYDKDKNDSENQWWEGLTTKQMVEGMEITAMPATNKSYKSSSSTEQDIEVTWVFPSLISKWGIQFKIDSIDGTENVDWNSIEPVITTTEVDEFTYKYRFCKCITFTSKQYIVYYKIMMTDTNGEQYENIVSFLVFPEGRQLRITFKDSEATVDSKIYGAWLSTCLFNIIHSVSSAGSYKNFTLSAYSPVYFWINSDFSSKGFGTVTHYSNSSYCKVTKLATPSSISGKVVEATLQYSFEDLPVDMLRHEDSGYFDYDDVIFTVDIIKP
ncbi:MAG TPA: hypothetical protein P5120_19515 [Spirochaetota bacterium]|nr:hypothetical protein [Spirochaetota bacterium]